MKRKAFLTLLLVLPLSTPICAQTDTLPDGLGKDIRTPEGLRALVERKDPRFVIVDVRSPEEYAAGHIPTAINIPGGATADIKAKKLISKLTFATASVVLLVVLAIGWRESIIVGAAVVVTLDVGVVPGEPALRAAEQHPLMGPLHLGHPLLLGIGLRLGSSRSSFGNVIHIDLAFPLDGGDDIDSVQLLVQTKASF